MATGKRGGGPGTYTENGVVCTMGVPFKKAAGSREGAGGGRYGSNTAPFDKPQGTGNGGIPTKFYDSMPSRPASTVNAGMTGTAGANRTAAVGNRRFKNPGDNT